MKTKSMIAVAAGLVLLVGATAGASVYVMDSRDKDKAPATIHSVKASGPETITLNQPRPPALPECDDDNIVGKVVGGAAGGIAGSQIGSGNGKTAATIGGTIGGALLGEEYIPTQNVTCR